MHIARFCTVLLAVLLFAPSLQAQQQKEADDLWFKVSRKLVELTQRIEALEKKVATQAAPADQQQMAQLSADVQNLRATLAGLSVTTGGEAISVDALNTEKQGEVTASCPAGSALTGLVVVDNDSGRNCKTCISGVRLLCSSVALTGTQGTAPATDSTQ